MRPAGCAAGGPYTSRRDPSPVNVRRGRVSLGMASRQILICLPAEIDGLLRQGQEMFGLDRVDVPACSEAQLSPPVIGQCQTGPRRVKEKGVVARVPQFGVVTDKGPVAARHGAILLVQAVLHVVTV